MGSCKAMDATVISAQALGIDVVLMTSPHPRSTIDWVMSPGLPVHYPVVAGPMVPTTVDSIVVRDRQRHGILTPASVRHEFVNEAMRNIASTRHVTLLDAEVGWFNAMEIYGEAALYGPGQFVHPNLLGHQKSYHKAVDAWISNFSK